MANEIEAKLDLETLQQKANEYAMKGAIKEIEEFYTSYDSPFRKKIKEELESKAVSIHLKLPDIIGLINESLSAEIDRIANNCIAETFMPLATSALTRIDKQIKFSSILEEFVKSCNSEFKDNYRPEITIDEDSKFGWLDIRISFTDYLEKTIEYRFTLHHHKDKTYHLLGLPYTDRSENYNKKIKLANGEGTIEMPFTRGSLKDQFTSYLARIVICKSIITMDCEDFENYMFEDL